MKGEIIPREQLNIPANENDNFKNHHHKKVISKKDIHYRWHDCEIYWSMET